MKTKRIFSKSLSMQLISKGHELIKVEPNNKIEGFLVYSFVLSDQLINDIWSINN
jgi:hypothetical protein